MPTRQFLTELEVRTSGTDNPLHLIGNLGALADGDNAGIALLQIDDTQVTGGTISLVHCLATTQGSGLIVGLHCGHGIDPIRQYPSDYVDVGADNRIDVNGTTNAGTELSAGGAGNITFFAADNDYVIVTKGSGTFDSMQIVLDTPATQDCEITWEYLRPFGSWTPFQPIDGTHGFQNTGVVLWNTEDFTGTGQLSVRMTRTANTLDTAPIVDLLQVGSGTALSSAYYWDKDGDVSVASVMAVTGRITTLYLDLAGSTTPITQDGTSGDIALNGKRVYRVDGTDVAVADGGTGFSTYALGDILYSDATNSLAKLSGNTAAIPKMLQQTGNGSVSAAPTWKGRAHRRVATQVDRTSNASFFDLEDLRVTAQASTAYKFRAVIFFTSNTSGGVKVCMNGTVSVTNIRYQTTIYTTGTVVSAAGQHTALAGSTGITAVTAGYIVMEGAVLVNAGGSLVPSIAQNASFGTASSFLVNSTFEMQEITN